MTTAFISTWQRGQSSGGAPGISVRAACAPQCEQNFAPTNIIPKQEGQATVAKRAPQWSQEVESVEAGDPHIGQFSVSASIDSRIVHSTFNCASRESASAAING